MAKAKQRGRPVREVDISCIEIALESLQTARQHLRLAGSHNAANYVQRALKSVQGALNNARAHLARQVREDNAQRASRGEAQRIPPLGGRHA